MVPLDFPADLQQFLHQEVASGKFRTEEDVVVEAVRRYRDSGTGLTAESTPDVLNWDNLIPIPPHRPGGRLRAHLKMAGRDQPLPADDPWAK